MRRDLIPFARELWASVAPTTAYGSVLLVWLCVLLFLIGLGVL